MERVKHLAEINILLGAWLIVAPFVMGYSGSRIELTNDVMLGVLLIGCAWGTMAATAGQMGASTLGLLAGCWLIVAPLVLHDQRMSRAFANDIGVGFLAVLVSAMAMWVLVSQPSRTA